jgi:polar amino acid transport system substrate-binding protein
MSAESARAELAPTGSLRAGINLSNTLFTRQRADGEVEGVSVDVMRELASRLGVPLAIVVYPTPGEVADVAQDNVWDTAILAIEPARAKTIDFSPPITEIEATYVVHDDSALRSVADVDKPGVRISAPEKAGYELFLTRTIEHARIVRAKSSQGAIDAFSERRADALSGLKPSLLDAMPKLTGARMLEGTFMTVNHGIGTPRSRPVGAAYLRAFVASLNADGFIEQSIARHQVRGLSPVKR